MAKVIISISNRFPFNNRSFARWAGVVELDGDTMDSGEPGGGSGGNVALHAGYKRETIVLHAEIATSMSNKACNDDERG